MSDFSVLSRDQAQPANASPIPQPNPEPDQNHTIFNAKTFGQAHQLSSGEEYQPSVVNVESAKRIAGLFLGEGELHDGQKNAFLLNQSAETNRGEALLGAAAHLLEQTPSVEGKAKHVILVVEKPEDVQGYLNKSQQLGFGPAPELTTVPLKQKEEQENTAIPIASEKKSLSVEEEKKKETHEKGLFDYLREFVQKVIHFPVDAYNYVTGHSTPAPAQQPHQESHQPPTQTAAQKQHAPTESIQQEQVQTKKQELQKATEAQAQVGDFKLGDVELHTVSPDGAISVPDSHAVQNPSVTVVTYDQLAAVLKNSKPEDVCMVACDNAEVLAKNKDAREALEKFQTNRVYATTHSADTLESLVAFEGLLKDNQKPESDQELMAKFNTLSPSIPKTQEAMERLSINPETGQITDKDQFRSELNRLETIQKLGLIEKDGALEITDPKTFAEQAHLIATKRFAEGTATSVETPHLGTIEPAASVEVSPQLNLKEAEKAILEYEPPIVEPAHEAETQAPPAPAQKKKSNELLKNIGKKLVALSQFDGSGASLVRSGLLDFPEPKRATNEEQLLGEILRELKKEREQSQQVHAASTPVEKHVEKQVVQPSPESPSKEAQLNALAEYSRADQIAQQIIGKIEAGESVVLYANQESVAAPALAKVEPWGNGVLIDGKIPSCADEVQRKISDYAEAHPEFAAKLGNIQKLGKESSDESLSQASNQFQSVPGGESQHSALIIADPGLASRANFSKVEEQNAPTNVIIAGYDHDQSLGEQTLEMAHSTSRPGAATPSNCQVVFTEGSVADQSNKVQLANELALKEAFGSKLAGTVGNKLTGVLGESQGAVTRANNVESVSHQMPAEENTQRGAALAH